MNPGDLLPVLTVDQPVDDRLGPVDSQLGEHNHAHDGKNQQGITRHAQNLLDLGNGEHGKDHHGAHYRPAQEVVDEIVPDHAVGRQRAKVGNTVGHEHNHQQNDNIAGKQQELQRIRGQRRLNAGQHHVGEHTQRRRDRGQTQIEHPPPRRAGQTAIARPPDSKRSPGYSQNKVEAKQPEERPCCQVSVIGLKDTIVYQQLRKENQAQRHNAGGVAQHDDDPAPACPQTGRAQDCVGELDIGCRYERDTNPLELQPALGRWWRFDGVEDYVAGIDKEHKN